MNRTLPQALDVERTILGSMIIDKKITSLVIEILDDEHFYMASNRLIYSTIKETKSNSSPESNSVSFELHFSQMKIGLSILNFTPHE